MLRSLHRQFPYRLCAAGATRAAIDVPQLQLNCMRAGALAFQAVEVDIGRLCGIGISRCPPEPVRVTCNVGTYYTIEPSIAPERRRDHQRLKSGGVGHSLTELSDARRYRSWRAANRVDPAHRVRAERRRRKTTLPWFGALLSARCGPWSSTVLRALRPGSTNAAIFTFRRAGFYNVFAAARM